MRVKSITYGRTFNDGNFESSRIDVTADVEPADTVDGVFEELIELVIDMRDTQLDYVGPKRRKK